MSDYWERRTAQFMWNCMNDAESSYKDIAKLYLKASRYLQEQMKGIFENYIKQTGLSETEARKLMSRLGTSDLQKLIKSLPKEVQVQIGADTAAYGARIHRYEELQRQVDSVMMEVYKQEKKISTKCYTKLAKDSYSFGVESVFAQAGQSVSFAHVDPDKVNQVLNSEWSGGNYSKRIWGNTQQVADTVKEEMAVCMLTGKSERAMADRLNKEFGVGASKARRLIRTESCYVTNQMVNKGYEDCGVEEYEFSAYLDSRTSDICRKLNGKRFKLSEAKVGVNMPPMHPWCRSTTLAVIDEELLKDPEDLELDAEEQEPEVSQKPDIAETEDREEWGAQQVKYEDRKVTYNPQASYKVEIPGYSEDVNIILSDAAKDVAERGSKDGYEHMHLIDLDTATDVFYETNNEPDSVGHDFWKIVRNNPQKKYAFVHNHNIVSSLSAQDLLTVVTSDNILLTMAVQNDGVIYYAKKLKDAPEDFYPEIYYEDELKELTAELKNGNIAYNEYVLRREKKIIELMLHDFFEGMVELDD